MSWRSQVCMERLEKAQFFFQPSLSKFQNESAEWTFLCFSSFFLNWENQMNRFSSSSLLPPLEQFALVVLWFLFLCMGTSDVVEAGGRWRGWGQESLGCTCVWFNCYGAKTTLSRRAVSRPSCRRSLGIRNSCNLLAFWFLLTVPGLFHLYNNTLRFH